MAAARHNLSRRAVLGVGVGACVAPGVGRLLEAGSTALPAPGGGQLSEARAMSSVPDAADLAVRRRRWDCALAAFRRATARLAVFQAEVDALPPERRAFPACEPIEERFGDLESARLAALRRLLRARAPNVDALALKIELLIDEQAWELTGAEACLSAIRDDGRHLAALPAMGRPSAASPADQGCLGSTSYST